MSAQRAAHFSSFLIVGVSGDGSALATATDDKSFASSLAASERSTLSAVAVLLRLLLLLLSLASVLLSFVSLLLLMALSLSLLLPLSLLRDDDADVDDDDLANTTDTRSLMLDRIEWYSEFFFCAAVRRKI